MFQNKEPYLLLFEEKKRQFVRIDLLVENRLNGNSDDRTSFIMELKLNQQHELYTEDLKIYSNLAHLKTLMNLSSKTLIRLVRHEGKTFRVVKVFCFSFERT